MFKLWGIPAFIPSNSGTCLCNVAAAGQSWTEKLWFGAKGRISLFQDPAQCPGHKGTAERNEHKAHI